MVPVLHAGTPHRVSLRGFERSHPQLVCVLIREMGSEARASLSSPRSGRSRPLTGRFGRAPAHVPAQLNVGT
jgi:hypothetical protein